MNATGISAHPQVAPKVEEQVVAPEKNNRLYVGLQYVCNLHGTFQVCVVHNRNAYNQLRDYYLTENDMGLVQTPKKRIDPSLNRVRKKQCYSQVILVT